MESEGLESPASCLPTPSSHFLNSRVPQAGQGPGYITMGVHGGGGVAAVLRRGQLSSDKKPLPVTSEL